MNVKNISTNDIDISGNTVSLNTSEAVSVVLVCDSNHYDRYIPDLITYLVPFKNLSLLYLDSNTYRKKYMRRYTSDSNEPMVWIFLNRMLYSVAHQTNITNEYITAILKNIYSRFTFKRNFINYDTCSVDYKFHE